jgi:hypothetical protein
MEQAIKVAARRAVAVALPPVVIQLAVLEARVVSTLTTRSTIISQRMSRPVRIILISYTKPIVTSQSRRESFR